MYFKYNISILALVAAISAAPTATAQLLDLDADVSIGADDGIAVDADASVGGSDGVAVDADASVGGDAGLDADSDVTIGGDSGSSDGSAVDADVDLLDGDEVVDAQVDIGGDTQTENVAGVTGTVRLASLSDDGAQADLLIGLLEDSDLANVNLDAVVDDEQVSIISVADLLGQDALAEVELVLGSGPDGLEDTQAAVAASVELQSVLANNGLDPEAVLAVQVGANGVTDVIVGDDGPLASVDISIGGDGGGGSGDGSGGNGGGSGDDGSQPGGNDDGAGGTGSGNGGGNDGSSDTAGGVAGGNGIAIDVANLGCPAGLEAIVSASNITPRLLDTITEVSVIAISGCPGGRTSAADEAPQIQAAIRQENDLVQAIRSEGFTVDNVIGAVADDQTLVLYVVAARV